MIAALEEAGMEGHWGYCWEQTYVDGITDYGHAPGLFFASQQSYKMPRSEAGGLVAIEWLSRDLNKAFWTGNPVHFAGEPDAFAVMGDWPEEETLAYFSHLVGQYLRNARAGQVIPFIFQEEAEQLIGVLGGDYAQAWRRMLPWITKALTPWSRHPEVEFTTMGALARRFRGGEWPWPRLYRAADRRCRILNDPRKRIRVHGAAFEFPEVLHYCSPRIFATFCAGSPTPLRLIRYDRQQECDVCNPLEGESRLPQLHTLERTAEGWHCRISSEVATPYALAIPVETGDVIPAGCVSNESTFVWEFAVAQGGCDYHLKFSADCH